MSGTKRKSSGSAEGSANKNMKMDAGNASMNTMERLFNNDLCIRAILKYLPLEDLANVSLASHFLKINAIIVFKMVHANTIEIEYDGNDFSKHQTIFRQFGSLATKVEVSTNVADDVEDDFLFFDDGGKILRTIGHFCGSNLKDLTLRRLKIDLSSRDYSAENSVEIRNVLAGLDKLTLMTVCIKSLFLIWARSLKELSIHSCCHMEKLPEATTLPQLKILQIGACPTWQLIPGNNFNEFLQMNPSIEEVDYHFLFIPDGHLESIFKLPKLTHVKLMMIDYDDEALSFIANARKLKELTICVDPSDRRQFLKLRNKLPTGCKYSVEDLVSNH